MNIRSSDLIHPNDSKHIAGSAIPFNATYCSLVLICSSLFCATLAANKADGFSACSSSKQQPVADDRGCRAATILVTIMSRTLKNLNEKSRFDL